MTSNAFSNERSFLNTSQAFNGAIYELWKVRFKIFIQSIDLESWETLINGSFVPTNQLNREVVDKVDFLLVIEKKRKFEIDIKTKNFLVTSLDDRKLLYVYNSNFPNETLNTLEMIYGASLSIVKE